MKFFNNDSEIFSGWSPGRLDVMGGIADYSGSLLLQMPIAETTHVEIQKREDQLFNIRSILADGETREVSCEYSQLANVRDWPAYVLGCFIILEREKNISFKGANILIRTNVPLGKGVSSSASLEVATMRAICKMYGIRLNGTELPVLAQKVENEIVGAACGLMDQLAVFFGQKNKLIPLQCQPSTVFDPIAIPQGIEFCGIDSGVRHAVGGSSYSEVRAAAFMGYSIIATLNGIDDCELQKAKIDQNFVQLPYAGYLANIPLNVFEKRYFPNLPETLKGSDFLQQYKISIDQFTHVDPEKTYGVRACTAHPVYENERVSRFQELLSLLNDYPFNENILNEMGKLMLASHESYSNVGLGNAATDEIVKEVCQAGAARGLYGARVSGGGNGGTVAILCKSGVGMESAKRIHAAMEKKFEKELKFFQMNK